MCGGMHGEDENSCEGYFCGDHRTLSVSSVPVDEGQWIEVCAECAKILDEPE